MVTHARTRGRLCVAIRGDDIETALAQLLAEAHPAKDAVLEVWVSISDHRACHGPLYGMSAAMTPHEALDAFVRQPEAYFMGAPGSHVPGRVWQVDGQWMGAVVDRQAAHAIRTAVAAAGHVLGGIVPHDVEEGDPEALAQSLATAIRSDPRVIDLEAGAREAATTRRRRGVLAVAACLCLTWALMAPTVAAHRRIVVLERSIQEAQQRIDETVRRMPGNRRISPAILDLERERHRLVTHYAALTAALPDSAAITALRLDARGGNASIVAASVGTTVAALDQSRDIRRLRVVGTISRETLDGIALERAALDWEHP